MKKFILMITLMLFGLGLNAQNPYRPSDPAPNVTINGGPYIQLNSIDLFEMGAYTTVNFKDVFHIGPYYQFSRKGNESYGAYTQINLFPKEYYFQVGLAANTGLYNHTYVYIEPMMVIQHNNQNDNIRFTHRIAFTGGPTMVSYSFGIVFGNFKEKWWKNVPRPYWKDNRQMNSMYREHPKFEKK